MNRLILVLFFIISGNAYSQTLINVNQIERKHQDCLDKGKNMLGCSIKFYNQSDSLLNLVYKKLKTKLNNREQAKLKNEQLAWLKKRDLYFKKAYTETKNGGPYAFREDIEIIYIDKKYIRNGESERAYKKIK